MSKDELYTSEWLDLYDKRMPDKMYKNTFKIILDIIKKLNPKAKSVLEIGCGTGRYTELFLKKGFAVKATDISKDAVARAKKRAKKAKFHVVSMSSLKEPQIYDVAACLFEVFRYNQTFKLCKETIKRVYKALKPDGLFLCDFGIFPVTRKFKLKYELKIGKKKFVVEETINSEGLFDVRTDKVTISDNKKVVEKDMERSSLLRIPESKMVRMLKDAGFKKVKVIKGFREKRNRLFVAQK